MRILVIFSFPILLLFSSCHRQQSAVEDNPLFKPEPVLSRKDISPTETGSHVYINTNSTKPGELVNYAESLTGTPYKFACNDPREGFDCSGFINYVFAHFNITVPRSSVEFTNVERPIQLKNSKRGDIILFTGTDSTIRVVGHMGIIVSNPGEEIKFIHSTSGKEYRVTTTPLNSYYQGRFVKVLRIFKQNDVE